MDKQFLYSRYSPKELNINTKYFGLKPNSSSMKEYLPLAWCKEISAKAKTLFGEKLLIEKLKLIASTDETQEAYQAAKDYSKGIGAMYSYYTNGNLDPKLKYAAYMCLWQDIDCITTVLGWERSKQVFKIDDDFLKTLLNTDNVMITKDLFNHLPYSNFYVDLSECEDICKEIDGEGFFVSVAEDKKIREKTDDNSEPFTMWQICLCKISKTRYQTDNFILKNEEALLNTCKLDEKVVLVNADEVKDEDNLYRKLAIQLLVYLSSVEPDVEDSEMTKETYRKPNPNFKPKNKFSEIKAWDVGIRYGTAFRNWKEKSEKESTTSVSTGTGSRKRPHCRKAHYHYFWYGKKDGKSERVKRQKWIAEMFINTKKDTNMPTVIHNVKERKE